MTAPGPDALDLDDDRLLDTAAAARFLGFESERALKKWRVCGVGPRWIKLGRERACPIRYRLGDLRAWLREGASLEAAA